MSRHFIRDADYPDELRPPFHSPLEAELARYKILLRPAELERFGALPGVGFGSSARRRGPMLPFKKEKKPK